MDFGPVTFRQPAVQQFAILPVGLFVASLLVTSWVVPSIVGYTLTGAGLVAICGLGALSSVRLETRRVVVVCLLGYLALLILQAPLVREPALLPYLVLTPLAMFVGLVVIPQFVAADREAYSRAMVGISFVLVAIGVVLLALELATGMAFPWAAYPVLGQPGYRIGSIVGNSNNFGAVLMVTTLIAMYLALHTRSLRWALSVPVLAVALVFTDAKSAIGAFVVGALLFATLKNTYVGIGLGVLSALGGLALMTTQFFNEMVTHAQQFGLRERREYWELAIMVANRDPLVGNGFETEILTHNGYIATVLHAGYPAGVLYITAILSALAYAIWNARAGDLWDIHVAAVLAAICIRMTMETFTFGGLSVDSILLVFYVGFAASTHDGPTESLTFYSPREALSRRQWPSRASDWAANLTN